AHSTWRGLGCIAWLRGSARGTEQYRSSKSAGLCGSPAAFIRVLGALMAGLSSRPAVGPCSPYSASSSDAVRENVVFCSVLGTTAEIVSGRGAPMSVAVLASAVGLPSNTEVTASVPCMDRRDPFGNSVIVTLSGSDLADAATGAVLPVTNT